MVIFKGNGNSEACIGSAIARWDLQCLFLEPISLLIDLSIGHTFILIKSDQIRTERQQEKEILSKFYIPLS